LNFFSAIKKEITSRGLLFLKGMLMGIADVIPGVSGGTIAFITGIYPQLLLAVNSINMGALKLLFGLEIQKFWIQIHGSFLLTLGLGLLLSLFVFANFIEFLLQNYSVQLWALFFGLILGSVIILIRRNPFIKLMQVFWFLFGVSFAVAVSTLPSIQNDDVGVIQMFFAGSVALCAMILPGISGSFILLLLGFYSTFIDAVANVRVDILFAFLAGGVIGLMMFSRFLYWVLKKAEHLFLSCMCGFLLGSLSIIWPWQAPKISEDTTTNIWLEKTTPNEYAVLTGNDPQVLWCLSLAFIGVIIVILLNKIDLKK
jgi:putative membrane protein